MHLKLDKTPVDHHSCISLAMAEMALVPSLYRKYGSRIRPGSEHIAPGITSRFEVFTDETYLEMKASVHLTGVQT